MSKISYLQDYAHIDWLEDGTPYSPAFDDIYWSRSQLIEPASAIKQVSAIEPAGELMASRISGLLEKQHVFIEANQLASRFSALAPGQQFTILETGFGFGLNFYLAARAWHAADKPEGAILQYVAFEQFLVSPDDLSRCFKKMTDPILDELLQKYPLPINGNHHIWLAGNICLTLVVGDISESLPLLKAKVDCCFLDGFSPAKNQAMWHETLLPSLTGLMSPGATLSSYTVAGFVRRGLKSCGLEVTKIKGFGAKSEMLSAKQPGAIIATSCAASSAAGSTTNAEIKTDSIVIIGAGLAGIFSALALEKRGISFTWLEAESAALGAVNQINQLAISPRLEASPQKNSLIQLLAFEYSRTHLPYKKSGQLRLLTTDEARLRATKLVRQLPESLIKYLTSDIATIYANCKIETDALYFPTAGWLDPTSLLKSVTQQPQFNRHVIDMKASQQGWQLTLKGGEVIETNQVILASGATDQMYLDPLPMSRLGGQSIRVKLNPRRQKSIISADVSVFPEYEGSHTVAGTFRFEDQDHGITEADSVQLEDKLKHISDWQSQTVTASYGIRRTSRDRLPILGAVPDWQALQTYLQEGPKKMQFSAFQPGLYCITAFGSHGATSAAYCAEHLIRKINNEPHSQLPELAVERFALRDGPQP